MANPPVRDPANKLPSDHAYREYPTRVYPYTAGLVGGLLGGVAMAAIGLLYGLVSGRGLWFPVNLIGATIVRDLQTMPEAAIATFNLSALLAATFLHFLLSAIIGLAFSLLLPALPGGRPILWALIIGPLLFAVAFFVTLPIVNPVMGRYIEPISFGLAHLVYGLVLGFWVARAPQQAAGFAPDSVGRPVNPHR